MAIGNSDGALHPPNRDDGAGLEAVGVVTELWRREKAAGFEIGGGLLGCA